MQEIITEIKTEVICTDIKVLKTLLNILINGRGYSFNSSEEIRNTIYREFKTIVSIDLIEELWVEGRMIDDVNYLYKHLY